MGCPVDHGSHRPLAPPPPEDPEAVAPPLDPGQVADFLWRFHSETGPGLAARHRQVQEEIAATGTYRHTFEELQWACRVAWRNAANCVGRAGWAGLKVRDRRHVTDPAGIAAETVKHALDATNGGRIRSTMTVFAPATPGSRGPRLWNEQIIRYAGDPRYATLLKAARRRGWEWDGDPWARLPLFVEVDDGAGPHLFDVPGDAALEVHLTHPEHPRFAELGLRWHALPAITSMRLEAGGLWYTAAPFNGWYVEFEIATSNLAHPDRLNALPAVADVLGLDRSQRWLDWRDRATLALNEAVLHSFQQAGVSISSKRQEADRLLAHFDREEAAGRADEQSANWSWVVPPSAYPVATYHHYYRHLDLRPVLLWNRPPAELE